jgi:hypothetical protein
VLRTLVTPGSTFLPFSAKAGEGMPQRIIDKARVPSRMRITGAVVLGKMPGSGGRLPVSSRSTLNTLPISDCERIRL